MRCRRKGPTGHGTVLRRDVTKGELTGERTHEALPPAGCGMVSRRDMTKGERTYEALPSTGCGTMSRRDVKGERQAHMRAVEKVPDWTWQGGTMRRDKGQAHR